MKELSHSVKAVGPFEIRYFPVRALRRAVRDAVARLARSGGTVVDFGCGERPYQDLFVQHGMHYVGCDLEGTPDVRFEPGLPLPLRSGSAALVSSFQVLEHVEQVDEYLGECRRLLDARGRLLLSTHGVWPYHPHPGDYQRWTRTGLELLLSRNSFRTTRITPLLGPLAWSLLIQGIAVNALCKRVGAPQLLLGPLNLTATAAMMALDAVTPTATTRDNACIYVVECERLT